ncbi:MULTISPECIES: VOC family protein [Lacticaseibacillus]|uniref:VOC family protein n=1 Tax=Lacticaseibacillus zeae subsp. silagei TaxID=3068307 RepID=A0ABD7Z6E6_LACZE|nr:MULTISPECIES: VOC family protein [Lacticaseibacillus]OFS00956.1 glyoxalase [Lactobacillus sp. HMSC068F07]MDE3282643.1 VOC family protein [Lacticaseibacillus casei]MDE3315443.1 VOC family protein [Lacticaseibacillus zeae]WLV82508.1 VOC family protein [Lacticaseibacillus sp. NCIMB 15475]WLV87664.1 VOC family protein [Lacticaseibacillus sp. NCIMB 15474]
MTRLHHVSLLTGDATATIHFYTNVLGLRLVKNTVNQENIHVRHLFFGDYQGTPGSVVTFFVIDRLGHRYDGRNQLGGIDLAIPSDSLPFWFERLQQAGCVISEAADRLTLVDPSDTPVRLITFQKTLPDHLTVPNDIPGNRQITGLINVDIPVADHEAEKAFFDAMLGQTAEHEQFKLAAGNTLTLKPSLTHDVKRFGRGSMDHFALTVDHEEALPRLGTIAAQHGYEVEEFADRGWFKSLYVRDPADNRIEFATQAPGFTLDEPLEHLGERLGLPPKFEARRATIESYFKTKGVDFHD